MPAFQFYPSDRPPFGLVVKIPVVYDAEVEFVAIGSSVLELAGGIIESMTGNRLLGGRGLGIVA